MRFTGSVAFASPKHTPYCDAIAVPRIDLYHVGCRDRAFVVLGVPRRTKDGVESTPFTLECGCAATKESTFNSLLMVDGFTTYRNYEDTPVSVNYGSATVYPARNAVHEVEIHKVIEGYFEYLHLADRLLGDLWDTLQSLDQYRDRTTLIVTTDHGRGLQGSDWAEHDLAIPGSEDIWVAVIGPDTPDVGEVTEPGIAYQGQVAATLLSALGLDPAGFDPAALPPLPLGPAAGTDGSR